MRTLIFYTFIIINILIGQAREIRVIDREENQPLPGSTVFSQRGVIIGITDEDGRLAGISDIDYPLTVKCLGFETSVCDSSTKEVAMTSAEYPLHEVTVTPADRPVVRVVCYIREYISAATGSDTVINFNEHMADFFLHHQKGKGYKGGKAPRLLRSRLYERKTDSLGHDSIYRPEFRRDDFAWDCLLSYPHEIVETTDSSDIYTDQIDYLAKFKDHTYSPWVFRLLGLTLEFDQLQSTWIYRSNAAGQVGPTDILSGTFTMSVLGKGKWIKKSFNTDQPIRMYGYYEIYPVEVQYLTKEEAKELKKDELHVRMEVPPTASPLSPAVQRMVDALSR